MKGTVKWFNEEKGLDLFLQKMEMMFLFTFQLFKQTDLNVLKKVKK